MIWRKFLCGSTCSRSEFGFAPTHVCQRGPQAFKSAYDQMLLQRKITWGTVKNSHCRPITLEGLGLGADSWGSSSLRNSAVLVIRLTKGRHSKYTSGHSQDTLSYCGLGWGLKSPQLLQSHRQLETQTSTSPQKLVATVEITDKMKAC
jgi:hypothetical protein